MHHGCTLRALSRLVTLVAALMWPMIGRCQNMPFWPPRTAACLYIRRWRRVFCSQQRPSAGFFLIPPYPFRIFPAISPVPRDGTKSI